jgi:hypothetical protein
MALSPDLLKILSKKYDPSALIEKRFRGYDLAIKTDEEGNPVLLFIGKKNETGKIRGNFTPVGIATFPVCQSEEEIIVIKPFGESIFDLYY